MNEKMLKNKEDSSPRIEIKSEVQETQLFRTNESKRKTKINVTAILAVVLVVLFICSLLFIVPYDQWEYSPAYIFKGVSRRFKELYQFFLGFTQTTMAATVWKYLAAVLAGSALAACGTVMQGSFRNILAGPSSMGAMSGGTLGCLVYVLIFEGETGALGYSSMSEYFNTSVFSRYGQAFFTLAGCFLGTILIMGIATLAGKGKLNTQVMIVCGMVFSQFLNISFTVVQYYLLLENPDDESISDLRSLMMGSFDNIASWEPVVMMAVPIIICIVILLILSGKLNLMSMDADSARTLGLNTQSFMLVILILNTVMTAVVISFCGQIGFLGFMLPLIGRKLVGPNMQKLLPVSILLGAILMLVFMDVASACAMTDSLNLFTSLIGTFVMFVVMIKNRKAGAGNAAFGRRNMQNMGR